MATLSDIIKAESDRCVKCGLCLPHCPTYIKTQHEGESPRGRIALLEGVAKQQLPITKVLQTHIDQCLSCRACESVCPAKVNYEHLLVRGRQYLLQKNKGRLPLLKRFLSLVITHPWALKANVGFLRLLQNVGLPLQPKVSKKFAFQSLYTPKNHKIMGKVGLSPGCIHAHFDLETLKSTISVLNILGYEVHLPQHFRCCGALHSHSGELKIAQALQQENKTLFEDLAVDAIISTASGCTPSLAQSHPKVFNITSFLLHHPWPENILFQPSSKSVVLHTPCTLRYVSKQEDPTIQLLSKIPGITLQVIQNKNCCGGAGTYFLEQKEMAKTLALDLIHEIKAQCADILLTSNIGCMIHLQREIQKQKYSIKIMHPMTFIAQQIKPSP